MEVDNKTLERLSNLELEQYAGYLNAIRGKDKQLYRKLMESPVEVKVMAQQGDCEDGIYELCLEITGKHDSFSDLKHTVIHELTQRFEPPGWNLLSVLFDGIYAGEPEDLLNYRLHKQGGILYPIQGMGKKLAEVIFFDNN